MANNLTCPECGASVPVPAQKLTDMIPGIQPGDRLKGAMKFRQRPDPNTRKPKGQDRYLGRKT